MSKFVKALGLGVALAATGNLLYWRSTNLSIV